VRSEELLALGGHGEVSAQELGLLSRVRELMAGASCAWPRRTPQPVELAA